MRHSGRVQVVQTWYITKFGETGSNEGQKYVYHTIWRSYWSKWPSSKKNKSIIHIIERVTMDCVDDAFSFASMSPRSLDINQSISQIHLALKCGGLPPISITDTRTWHCIADSAVSVWMWVWTGDCYKCCNVLRIVKTRKAISDLPS